MHIYLTNYMSTYDVQHYSAKKAKMATVIFLAATLGLSAQEHTDDDGHDHSAHEHPEHGLNGGHMVKLEDGSEIEVALNKEDDAFAIFPATPAEVSSIKMISKVGEEETTYEFTASESEESVGAFMLTSPELATAVRMGDTVEVTLVVETKDGSTSAKYEHHEH